MPRRSPISPPVRPCCADDAWERRHELAFALELNRGECEFLTGALGEAEQRLAALSTRAAGQSNAPRVACLRMDLYMALDQSSRAIAVGLDYLRHLGIDVVAASRPKRKRGANTSGSGRSSAAARSRR